MKNAIWIAFDLGVRGDYEGIYTWLDQKAARECGDNLAFLIYEYSGEFLKALTDDLSESIEITKRTRIYAVYRDPKTKKLKGSFVVGGRKAAPWTGYAVGTPQIDADEA